MSDVKGSAEKVGYWRAISSPRYRVATIMCILLATANQITGINAINMYSTTIYQDI